MPWHCMVLCLACFPWRKNSHHCQCWSQLEWPKEAMAVCVGEDVL